MSVEDRSERTGPGQVARDDGDPSGPGPGDDPVGLGQVLDETAGSGLEGRCAESSGPVRHVVVGADHHDGEVAGGIEHADGESLGERAPRVGVERDGQALLGLTEALERHQQHVGVRLDLTTRIGHVHDDPA